MTNGEWIINKMRQKLGDYEAFELGNNKFDICFIDESNKSKPYHVDTYQADQRYPLDENSAYVEWLDQLHKDSPRLTERENLILRSICICFSMVKYVTCKHSSNLTSIVMFDANDDVVFTFSFLPRHDYEQFKNLENDKKYSLAELGVIKDSDIYEHSYY